MKKIFAAILSMIGCAGTLVTAQPGLPVKEWRSDNTPLVLYISGDGGLNSFTTGFCDQLHGAGYGVMALNAKAYFSNKKTAEETTRDITVLLRNQFGRRKNQQLLLIGYSFGADVMPFIVNRLPDDVKTRLLHTLLISPSTSTDFETHWGDMLGISKKRSMDVVAEINRMQLIPVVSFFGSDEKDFPVKSISLKNYKNEWLSGGHHYDGDPAELVNQMKKYLK